MINYVNLYDLTHLYDDEVYSEKYVRYLTNFPRDKKYRHEEIEQIHRLLNKFNMSYEVFNNFLYGYSFHQLSKEFDLLCFTEKYSINIELKTTNTHEKIIKQLKQNEHYLSFLGKEVVGYSYIADINKLVKVNANDELEEVDFEELRVLLSINHEHYKIDLDKKYDSKEILVSPLNETLRFVDGNYILTEYQEKIKRDIISYLIKKPLELFYSISGGAGTGKTMLVYDIVKELSKGYKLLIIHNGKLCNGHKVLKRFYPNIEIVELAKFDVLSIINYDFLIIDEAQRLEKNVLDEIIDEAMNKKIHILFSYDHNQMYFDSNYNEDFANYIASICNTRNFRLTNKIRSNKEISTFINCLLDLSKRNHDLRFSFDNVHIIFEDKKNKIYEIIREYKLLNYHYVSLEDKDYKKDNYVLNTIGQEFNKVIIHMGEGFYYDDMDKLKSKDEIKVKLLYQGLTRVKKDLVLIISDKDVLYNVLRLYRI